MDHTNVPASLDNASTADRKQWVADNFNKNFTAIQAYKQAHGGDWEGAYTAVTGYKWPGGQDIKIQADDNGNQYGKMVKDPGTLGDIEHIAGRVIQIAGPIIATALTGGAAAPLLGAAAAAGGGALAGDRGKKLLLEGALGAVPGVVKAIHGAGGLASTAKGIPNPDTGAALTGSTAVTNLQNGAIAPLTSVPGAATTAAGTAAGATSQILEDGTVVEPSAPPPLPSHPLPQPYGPGGPPLPGSTPPAFTPPTASAPSTPGGTNSTKWLGPLIQNIAPAAGAVIAAKVGASANTDAAKLQAASTQAALDFEKQTYNDKVARLTPYINAGAGSVDQQNRLLGLPPTPTPPNPSSPGTGTNGYVQVKAPTGQVAWIPPNQVDKALQLGATRV